MKQKLLLPLLILALAALAGVLWTLSDAGPGESVAGLEHGGGGAVQEEPDARAALPDSRGLAAPPRVDEDLSTTVVIPLEVELELVEAKARLDDDGAPPLGSAATARLRGSMHGADGRGLRGHVEFVAGPNRGRVLDTDDEGRFGAHDLLSGLSLVALRAPGVPGAEREVLLREKRESQLNVGFGRPASVRGLVRDHNNVPLPGATVVVDGQETVTDDVGRFYFARVASGKVPIYVMKPGYASQRQMQAFTAGMNLPTDSLKFNLRPAATLRVQIPERIGLGIPGQLFLSGPLDGTGQRGYPWHLKSPIAVHGGETVEIEDLPAGRVRLQYFRAGAVARPAVVHETLIEGQTRDVTIHLEPAALLAGVVKSGGSPVSGARVRLEAPDVSGASVTAMGERFGRATLEMEVLSRMPPAVQTTITGGDGRFRFSAAEQLSSVRYLTATSADGKAWAGRVVRKGEKEVELLLEPAREGLAGLRIETSERFQALPVDYVVDGRPDSTLLAPGARLAIEGLPEGSWKVRVNWGGEVILRDVPLELHEVEDLFIPLPEGAIQGQSKQLRDALKVGSARGN